MKRSYAESLVMLITLVISYTKVREKLFLEVKREGISVNVGK